MTQIDYQPFGSYYSITKIFQGEPNDWRNGQPILYGAPRMHYIKCTDDIYYIRLAKDPEDKLLDIDTRGEYLCDFTLASLESQTLAMQYMQTGDKAGFHPVTQAILVADEQSSQDYAEIAERRGGIMTVEFLGFVPDHVYMIRPELAGFDEVDIEGEIIKTPKFNPGNWCFLDNPEFLGA
jgi:hypothetical protein